MAGQIGPNYFNFKTLVCSEFMFFILPEYRGIYGGKMLMDKCQAICKRMNVSKFCMGHTLNGKVGKFKRFSERAGFMRLETHYVKDLN